LAETLFEDREVIRPAKRCQIPEIGTKIRIAFKGLQEGSLRSFTPPGECVAGCGNAGHEQETRLTTQGALGA
jgi:hypothetical protein